MAVTAMVEAVTAEVAVATEAVPQRYEHAGGCHCGALRWTLETQQDLSGFIPRACDCDFCTRHRAAWLSDPAGTVRIESRDGALCRYRQGSAQAEFLLCGRCGVLVAATCATPDGGWRAALNRNSADQRERCATEVVASPQQLAAEAKRARWLQLWTPATLSEG